jgi:hypothetical protein
MSVKVMGRVWDLNLPPNQKLVLMAYADAAEHDGTKSFPGHERLSEMTGYSRAQVQRITNQLVDNGLLEQVSSGRRGQRAEFIVKVLQDAPLEEEIVAHGGRDSGAQLRATSRPDPSYNASTSSNGFTAFNAKRAVEAVRQRKRNGLKVKSEAGLAMTIQQDPDFVEESRELWAHRDCDDCGGKGFKENYAPGAGQVQVKCEST